MADFKNKSEKIRERGLSRFKNKRVQSELMGVKKLTQLDFKRV